MISPSPSSAAAVPLVVDLDGALARTDTLHEGALAFAKRRPFAVWRLGAWLASGGKAHLKAQLAAAGGVPDAALLPYDPGVLELVREARAAGRPVWLATAADVRVAEAVAAAHPGLFDRVLASDGRLNREGARKLAAVREHHAGPFDYVGNSGSDLHVWREAREVVVAGGSRSVERRARALGKPTRVLPHARPDARAWLKALRLHQWAKNLLVFVPVLAAHRAEEPALLLRALAAFLAFGLTASSVYLVNDLLDLDADRRHHKKRLRPFAAGRLPVLHGVVAAPLLLAGGLALALAALPAAFCALLGGYFALTLGYSLWLKQVAMLDVLALAGLYTVRVLAGSFATHVPTSSWLFTFSMFLFLSLALVKRVSEVRRLRGGDEAPRKVHGRGYGADDLDQLRSLGTSAGLIAVLVLALYISGEDVGRLYTHPQRLWLVCPLALYWVGRVWMLAHRGEMDEDPVVFALKDRVSYGLGALGALVVWLAT